MPQFQADLLANEATHHQLQFREYIAKLQNLRPQGLPPREGKQLPHETGSAIGVLLDLHNVLKGRISRPMIGEQQIVNRIEIALEHYKKLAPPAAAPKKGTGK